MNKKLTTTLALLISTLTLFSFSQSQAAKPSDFGLKEGNVISATGDPDVYIVNEHGFKRLFVNPEIFNLYGHLGWDKIKKVTPETRDAFVTSGLFRNCESGDERVHGLDVVSEDVANLRWVNTTGTQAVADDPDFFKKVFCVNNRETKLYGTGVEYSSVRQIPDYTRKGIVTKIPTPTPTPTLVSIPTPIPASTTLRIDLVAPNKILAGSPYNVIIKGSGFNKNAKVDFGAGNIEIGYAIVNDAQISVLVPSGLPSLTYNLSITNPDGQIATLRDALTVQAAPAPAKNAITAKEIFEKVGSSVVRVECTGGGFIYTGSGFVFESDGYILTNEHVIDDCVGTIKVIKDSSSWNAQILGANAVDDVAVLKISQNLPALTLGNSSEIVFGSRIFVVAHPAGFSNAVANDGLINSNGQACADNWLLSLDPNLTCSGPWSYLTTLKLAEHGSSGGLWVNEKGEAIGLHRAGTSSISLAIPINFVKTLIPALKAGTSTPAPSSTPSPSSTPTPTPTPSPGTISVQLSPDTPERKAIYWGQTNAPLSKFKFTSTGEGKFIEKLTIATLDPSEKAPSADNIKNVNVTYKNKAGDTLTKSQTFGSAAFVNFAWGTTDANRPYVPQDSNMELSVNADLRTKAEGATPSNALPATVYFSLDLSNSFNGSLSNGFRAVGEYSGSVTDGGSINNITSNDQYVYRVFPEISQVALTSPYNLIGTPVVFKFTVTAKGLSGSTLRFDNENVGSGSIKFEVQASGQWSQGGTSTSFTIFDENNTTIDSGALTGTADANPAKDATLTFDFSSADVEISAGQTKTFSVQITNPGTNYAKPSSTGRAADYFQLTLVDDIAGNINWVADYNNGTTSADTASVIGTLKNLPLYGPTFQR